MRIHPLVFVFAFAAIATPVVAASPPVLVSQCGITVPKGRVGLLTGDLDCPAHEEAIVVGRHAVLDLQGHTLSGGRFATVVCEPAVCTAWECAPKGFCEVRNGAVVSAGRNAIVGSKVVVRNVNVDGNGGDFGVRGFGRVTIVDSHVENAAVGIQGKVVALTNTSADGAQISGGRIVLTASSVTNGFNYGVDGTRVTLKSSTVTGNGLSPDCSLVPCFDVGSVRRPKLDATSSCGTSIVTPITPPGQSWGVCTND